MTKEQAITVLSEELHHVSCHLKYKGKAPEYYEEMKDIHDALELAIKSLQANIGE